MLDERFQKKITDVDVTLGLNGFSQEKPDKFRKKFNINLNIITWIFLKLVWKRRYSTPDEFTEVRAQIASLSTTDKLALLDIPALQVSTMRGVK